MKEKNIILITGAPATGKTTYGRLISKKFEIPFISKDKIKETVYDAMSDNKLLEYEEKRKIGSTSYSILYLISEELMKVGNSFILESNFGKQAIPVLENLISKYKYNSLTIRFNCETQTLHKRFLKREQSEERHMGLVANGVFDKIEDFKKTIDLANEFKISSNEIIVDTTDFNHIDINKLIEKIEEKLS